MIYSSGNPLVLRWLFFGIFYASYLLSALVLVSPVFAEESQVIHSEIQIFPSKGTGEPVKAAVDIQIIPSKSPIDSKTKQPEQKKQWTDNELLTLINNKETNKLMTFIQQASEAEVNRSLTMYIFYQQSEMSLLSVIIHLGDKALVESLLAKGAKPEGGANSMKPPLLIAMEQEQWEIARLLLDAGANPAVIVLSQSSSGIKIPLFYKALQDDDYEPFVEMAIEFKPELIVTDDMKKSKKKRYLELVLENSSPVNAVRYVVEQGDVLHKPMNQYGTPYEYFLYRSASYGAYRKNSKLMANQQATLNFFLDQGVPVTPSSKGDQHCNDPLYIVQSDLKTLNHLLEKGFDPNKVSCYEDTHLRTAAELGHVPIFQALVEAGGVINSNTLQGMIRSSSGHKLVLWVWQHKPDIFKQCKIEDCSQYLQDLIDTNKVNGDFVPIIDTLLIRLSGNIMLLNQLLNTAIANNNTDFANRLLVVGADPLDIECDCQQDFWQEDLKTASITWLVDHQVSPFTGDKPLHDVVRLENIPAKLFETLLKMAPKEARSKKNLHHWLILLLGSFSQDLDVVNLQEQLAVLAHYQVTVNNVLDEEGGLYLPQLINGLIKRQGSTFADIKLIWLLRQGAKPTAENQSHYIGNAYLRALMDRAGESEEKLDMKPQNPLQTAALQALRKKSKIRIFGNASIDLKTQGGSTKGNRQLEVLFATQLKQVDRYSLDETRQTLATLIQRGGKLPDKALEIFIEGTPLINTYKRYSNDDRALSQADFIAFIKQLVVAGADPTIPLLRDGYSLMQRLPLNDTGQTLYNALYADLSFTQKIRLWNALPIRLITSFGEEKIDRRKTIMLTLTVLLLIAEMLAFIALIVYFWKINKHPVAKRLIPTWPIQSAFLAGGALFLLALFNLLSLDATTEQLSEMIRQKDPRLDDESFILTFELFQWSTWMSAWIVVVIAQVIALLCLFKRVFMQKNYYAITFFASILFFFLTLLLPLLLLTVAKYHDSMQFPLFLLF